MHGVTNEDLMAWVDGELPSPEAERMAVAVAADAALAARVARLQGLNQRLREVFAAELTEPVPEGLAAIARGDPLAPAAGGATITPLASRHRRPSWAQWGGIAAGVLLAVGLLQHLGPGAEPGGDLVQAQADGRLTARGALEEALEHRLSGQVAADGTRLLLSFRDRDGQFCRSFAAPVGRGLACREAGRWRLVVLAAPAPGPTAPAADRLRLASGELPAEVLDAVERRIAGLALDAEQERTARDAGWRP